VLILLRLAAPQAHVDLWLVDPLVVGTPAEFTVVSDLRFQTKHVGHSHRSYAFGALYHL
jgi:hypothetical protein